MSAEDENSASRKEKIGYRSPPPEHRYKPGQSGNPLGRPHKSKTPTGQSSVDRAYLTEAQRPIRVKDDNGVQALPAINVVVRNQAMAAVKGDLKAQKDFATNTRLAELTELSRNEKLFEATIEYKALCELICEDHESRGLQTPTFDLDPNHLITAADTRTVRLSAAARNLTASKSRALDDMRRELVLEREALTTLLADQTENVVIRREIDFVASLLKRLDTRT